MKSLVDIPTAVRFSNTPQIKIIMGQYAEDVLNGLCDESGDYTYKDNIKASKRWVKDTPAEANIRKVRKELAILINRFQKENKPQPISNARKYINLKYGKGWRERGLVENDEDQWKPLNQYKEPKNFNHY
jgi:hypothetical protein